MPKGMAWKVPADYDQSVFINCPFDETYLPLFRALTFAVFECGLIPRCSQEAYDAGEVRIEKIARIIRDCRWGIHDISRTDLTARGLPRFNMPLELGLFLGAKRFGPDPHDRKSCLVLDRETYRYQEFISDISGQDIAAHGNDPGKAIKAVRDWLSISKAGIRRPPGAAAISARYGRFTSELPRICADAELDVGELTFVEYADIASTWLARELAGAS
ncbi:MAG TPA: hypothetical protein VGG99_28140 [Acetobacteraceae bacterium]|jgi:hypothetical protein